MEHARWLLFFAWLILPLSILARGVWLFFALERTVRRLGLSSSEGGDRITGSWQQVAIEITQHAYGEGKGPYRYEIVARARLPVLGTATPSAGAILDPVTVAAGWLEHRRDGKVDHRTLESLLDELARTAHRLAARNSG